MVFCFVFAVPYRSTLLTVFNNCVQRFPYDFCYLSYSYAWAGHCALKHFRRKWCIYALARSVTYCQIWQLRTVLRLGRWHCTAFFSTITSPWCWNLRESTFYFAFSDPGPSTLSLLYKLITWSCLLVIFRRRLLPVHLR